MATGPRTNAESELRAENEALKAELARTRIRMSEIEALVASPVELARELVGILEETRS